MSQTLFLQAVEPLSDEAFEIILKYLGKPNNVKIEKRALKKDGEFESFSKKVEEVGAEPKSFDIGVSAGMNTKDILELYRDKKNDLKIEKIS